MTHLHTQQVRRDGDVVVRRRPPRPDLLHHPRHVLAEGRAPSHAPPHVLQPGGTTDAAECTRGRSAGFELHSSYVIKMCSAALRRCDPCSFRTLRNQAVYSRKGSTTRVMPSSTAAGASRHKFCNLVDLLQARD
jgi:hypothetical protein